VGTRSSTETIVAILKALLDRRTWKQADLARHVGIAPAALHKRLLELQANGIPLESEREHPHVYWSVPKHWYPGGVFFKGELVEQIFRQLSRLPKSKARNQLLDNLLKFTPNASPATALVPPGETPREELHLPTIEDAAGQGIALRFCYFSASRGSEGMRHASVHRVVLGPRARFVATCHRSGGLKWFRIDNVSDSKLDPSEPFHRVEADAIDRFLSESLDGFHTGGPPVRHAFFVREPEARWAARNLLDDMQATEVTGGIHVAVQTAALGRLARYVVGLGDAAKPLTLELQTAVRSLAEGALASISAEMPRSTRTVQDPPV
jgi:predicted DNA-binding transcriptional regulator YafY